MKARLRTALLLEAHRQDQGLGKTIDRFLIFLIVANVAAIILETVDPIRQQWGDFLYYFELFSVGIFTIEYVLRVWSCVEQPDPDNPARHRSRLKWVLSPMGIIDLMAILPTYIYLFIPGAQSLLMLRVFRGLRLLRVFKLTRYSPALNMMFTVLRKESRVLTVAAMILLIMLIVASWGIYLLEHDEQPDQFSSIPKAMWWAVISLTTVGYGDVVPVTNGGKLFAGLVALLGIGMMALPAAILASGFYREVHGRSETYRRAVEMALKSGQITEHEAQELEVLREDLGIDSEEAMKTLIRARHERFGAKTCPHCGKSINKRAQDE